jgi:hypothetical protein
MFTGSSDLNTTWSAQAPPAIPDSDLVIGTSQFDTSSTVTSGVFQHGGNGVI